MLSPSRGLGLAIRYLWGNVLEMFVGALLAVLVLVVLAGIVSRYVMNSPLPWTEELSRYIFIWISFVGAGVGVRTGANFGLNLLASRLPPRGHAGLEIVVNLIVAAFGAVLAYYGWQIMPIVGMQKASSLPFSLNVVFLAIVVGGVLMLVNGLVRVFESARVVAGRQPVAEAGHPEGRA